MPTGRDWVTHLAVLAALSAVGGAIAGFEAGHAGGGGFINVKWLGTYFYFCALGVYAVSSTLVVAAFARRVPVVPLHGVLLALILVGGAAWHALNDLKFRRDNAPRGDLETVIVLRSWKIVEGDGGPLVVADLDTNFDGSLLLASFRASTASGVPVLALASGDREPARTTVNVHKGGQVTLSQRVTRVGKGVLARFELFFSLSDGDWRNQVWYLPDHPVGRWNVEVAATYIHRTPAPEALPPSTAGADGGSP